jgi:DNA-binding MarR family transcriptional regulator
MTTENSFVDNYIAYLLARASHLVSSEFHAVIEASGLSLMEWRVMASLSGKDSLNINELSQIVLAKQPTVTKLIGRMEEAGWVNRYDAIQDKRQSLVSLTQEGRQKVEPLLVLARTHEIKVAEVIGLKESIHLKKILKHLIEVRNQI